MRSFCIEIAGRCIQLTPLFESTYFYFQKYLTQRPPEVSIALTREDLAREQQLLFQEANREGLRPRRFPEPFLERSAIQRQTAWALLRWNILMVHGSTVAVEGKAYLFTAPCGTGKSTHTRLWRQVFGEGAVMVNDDKPFLKLTEEGVFACGSPWSGKHGLDTNITLPLQGICILARGQENKILPIAPEQALPELEDHWDLAPFPEESWKPLAAQISRRVPLWQMQCNREPEAAQAAYAHMSRNNP